jgi:hypothetical protein
MAVFHPPLPLVITALLSGFPHLSRAAAPLPSPSEVTRQMIDRSQAVARGERAPPYIYEKRSLIEHLDSAGQVVSSEDKLYEVTFMGGLPFNRLLKIQGRDLTPAELEEQQRREDRFQQKVSSMDPKRMAARKEGLISAELLGHYQFAVKDRVLMNDRPTLVLAFKPKEGDLPSDSIRNKVLNRIEGTLWVDEQEAETVKVTAHLTETISLGWFGLLGSLSRCEFALDRQRMSDGAWVNLKQAWSIQCRRLTTTMRFRITETCSKFHPMGAAPHR